jgi:hypothetical protein
MREPQVEARFPNHVDALFDGFQKHGVSLDQAEHDRIAKGHLEVVDKNSNRRTVAGRLNSGDEPATLILGGRDAPAGGLVDTPISLRSRCFSHVSPFRSASQNALH